MFQRTLSEALRRSAEGFPVVTLMGPRQAGKTTMVRSAFPTKPYMNLEDPDIRLHAQHDPRSFLDALPDGGIIDEVQYVPTLLSYIQTIVDQRQLPGMFILTGSKQLLLLEQVSQSLAGRTSILELLPLSLEELSGSAFFPRNAEAWVWHGMYPGTFRKEVSWEDWYRSYTRTYVERDVRQIKQIDDLVTFQDFLVLSAGRTGQLLNLSSLAGDCGIAPNTAKSWIGLLEASYIAWHLSPLHTNLIKQRTHMSKLHFFDTGLACYLLGITSPEQLRTHPLRGALFETAVVNEFLKARFHRAKRLDLRFYRDRSRREVDLILPQKNNTHLIVEAKSAHTYNVSLHHDLAIVRELIPRPTHSYVVYAGEQSFTGEYADVIPWTQLEHIAKIIAE